MPACFSLRDDCAARLALLMLALKQVRHPARMAQIAMAIAAMPDEECDYWFSKCLHSDRPRQAQLALRALLA